MGGERRKVGGWGRGGGYLSREEEEGVLVGLGRLWVEERRWVCGWEREGCGWKRGGGCVGGREKGVDGREEEGVWVAERRKVCGWERGGRCVARRE